MAYVRKEYVFKKVIEVEEYHNGRYGAPGSKRQKKKKQTKEQIEKVNQFNKTKRARHKLRAHFKENDYFVCLTYKKDERPPNIEEAKDDFTKFSRSIRRKYKDLGYELKWMRNVEVGSRGAIHIHLVINRIPDADVLIKKEWDHGGVHIQLLYEQGNFKKLAEYITKTEKNSKGLKETNYSTSRNLPVPEPKKKVMKGKTFHSEPKKKGYVLDKESYYEGINPVTGYAFRYYTLIKYHRRT